MAKISVSLPPDMVAFLDTLGPNRSKTILEVLSDYRERRRQHELAQAYDDYAVFCKEDDQGWWADWEAAAARDTTT